MIGWVVEKFPGGREGWPLKSVTCWEGVMKKVLKNLPVAIPSGIAYGKALLARPVGSAIHLWVRFKDLSALSGFHLWWLRRWVTCVGMGVQLCADCCLDTRGYWYYVCSW